MKSILVPVDFSIQAEYAAKAASIIAKQTNSKLYLLHMFCSLIKKPHLISKIVHAFRVHNLGYIGYFVMAT